MKKMNSKPKTFIRISVIGIVLIGGWWIWTGQIYAEAQEVTITIDKVRYKQGEKINATLSYDSRIYKWSNLAWSIQKCEDGSWVTVQRRADPYFFCANIPECKSINLETIEECPLRVSCERPCWYEVKEKPKLIWDQSYKTEEKTFQCEYIERIRNTILHRKIVSRTCVIFKQVPRGKYKIRFEYATAVNPVDPFSREVDIKYAEREIVIE